MCHVNVSAASNETYTSSAQYDEEFFLNLSVHSFNEFYRFLNNSCCSYTFIVAIFYHHHLHHHSLFFIMNGFGRGGRNMARIIINTRICVYIGIIVQTM
jgi:hypothetical protein